MQNAIVHVVALPSPPPLPPLLAHSLELPLVAKEINFSKLPQKKLVMYKLYSHVKEVQYYAHNFPALC